MDAFILFRPIFYLIALLLISNFLYLTALNKKLNTKIYILLNSIIVTLIGLVLLFQEGIIVDEFNLSGDPVTFYLSIFFIIMTILTSLFSFKKNIKE